MAAEITRNACERLKQIMNLNENAARKIIKRAYVWGTNIRDLPVAERKYLESFVDTRNRNAFVYAGCYFVFAGDYCVTVLRTPSFMGQRSKFDGKTKVKNPKKYMKYHDPYECEGFDLCA